MESFSPEQNPATYFGFNDLHGFKDFVGYVFLCAPDEFPTDDWLDPSQQMDLDRAFIGLRYGLDLAAKEKGENDVVSQCRRLVDKAYTHFTAGEDSAGRRALNEVRTLLKRLPSR